MRSILKPMILTALVAMLLSTAPVYPAAADSGSDGISQARATIGAFDTGERGVLSKAGLDGYKVGVMVDRGVLDSEKMLDDGSKRYQGAFKGVDLIAKQDELTFRVLAILADASSEHKLAFELDLPDEAHLSLQSDGSVVVLVDGTVPVGAFNPPWALDVNGDRVETFFEIEGRTLIQHVVAADPDAYPVYADPDFDAGIFSSTIYFNRNETSIICSGGAAVFTWLVQSGTYWLLITGPARSAILAAAAAAVAVACYADARSRCLKIKLSGHIVPVPLSYRNSQYCT